MKNYCGKHPSTPPKAWEKVGESGVLGGGISKPIKKKKKL